jgi:ABC-type multidrug transport system permease subunit
VEGTPAGFSFSLLVVLVSFDRLFWSVADVASFDFEVFVLLLVFSLFTGVELAGVEFCGGCGAGFDD